MPVISRKHNMEHKVLFQAYKLQGKQVLTFKNFKRVREVDNGDSSGVVMDNWLGVHQL